MVSFFFLFFYLIFFYRSLSLSKFPSRYFSLSISVSLSVSISLYLSLSQSLSLALSLPLSVSLSLSLSLSLSISLCLCLYLSLSLSLSPCLCLCRSLPLSLSASVSVYLSVSLSFSLSLSLSPFPRYHTPTHFSCSIYLSFYSPSFPSLTPSFCVPISLCPSLSLPPTFHNQDRDLDRISPVCLQVVSLPLPGRHENILPFSFRSVLLQSLVFIVVFYVYSRCLCAVCKFHIPLSSLFVYICPCFYVFLSVYLSSAQND